MNMRRQSNRNKSTMSDYKESNEINGNFLVRKEKKLKLMKGFLGSILLLLFNITLFFCNLAKFLFL